MKGEIINRFVKQSIFDELLTTTLYKTHLKNDIEKGHVYPALRKDEIDFYYRGGKLFGYDKKGFSTHIKYASVIRSNRGGEYISESELKNNGIITLDDFDKEYIRIQENCERYAFDEDIGISTLYHNFSITNKKSNVIVLDIEISLEKTEDDERKNRIDLLLYNKQKKTLRFYEAKNYLNKEIWSKDGVPKVKSQIARYNKQIKRDYQNIFDTYSKYIEQANLFWNCELPLPEKIEDQTALLVFGFDIDQRDGRLKSLLLNKKVLGDIRCYSKGKIKDVNIETLWAQTK